jgi:hypothetical protein
MLRFCGKPRMSRKSCPAACMNMAFGLQDFNDTRAELRAGFHE